MHPSTRFWLFVYSTPNIVGCLLGLLGLTLYFTGIIHKYWPLIVAGLYLAGVIGWPRDEQITLRLNNDLQEEQIEGEFKRLLTRIQQRVAPEIFAKVENITGLVLELLPHADGDPKPRHVLVQTATDYLPSILEHYLNLPPTYARVHKLRDGKTARQLLLEQLTLLEDQLQAIAHDFHAGNTDALRVYSRFLSEKFAKDRTWDV